MTRSHRKCSQCSARKKVRLLQDCRRCLYRMNGSCLTNPQRESRSQRRLRSARTTRHFVRIDLTMTGTCPSVHRVCAGATSFRLPCRSPSVTTRLAQASRRQESVSVSNNSARRGIAETSLASHVSAIGIDLYFGGRRSVLTMGTQQAVGPIRVVYESEPRDHGVAARALPSISAAFLRGVFAKRLRTSDDLSAFVLDYFGPVHRQFSSGMTRVRRGKICC